MIEDSEPMAAMGVGPSRVAVKEEAAFPAEPPPATFLLFHLLCRI